MPGLSASTGRMYVSLEPKSRRLKNDSATLLDEILGTRGPARVLRYSTTRRENLSLWRCAVEREAHKPGSH